MILRSPFSYELVCPCRRTEYENSLFSVEVSTITDEYLNCVVCFTPYANIWFDTLITKMFPGVDPSFHMH